MEAPIPVLMVGWDSAPAGLVRSMLAAGKLPNLAALLAGGRVTPVHSYAGLGDDGNWLSFSTAKPPGAHGRFGFHKVGVESYDVLPLRRDEIAFESFWNRIADRVEKVVVVDVPKSPLGNRSNIVEVADWLSHGPDFDTPSAHPPDRLNPFISSWGGPGPDPCVFGPEVADDLAPSLDRRREIATEAFCEVLKTEKPDFSLLVYSSSHCTAHRFWHLFERGVPSSDQTDHPLVVQLERLDRDLATLRSCYPEQVRMGVFALNGSIESNQRDAVVVESLRRLATVPLFQSLRPVAAGQTGAALRDDVRRRVLRLGGRVVPHLPRPLRRKLRSYRSAPDSAVAAQRRQAPFYSYSQAAVSTPIRINLAGRDLHGWVPSDQYDRVCADLVEKLMELRNSDTGERVLAECILVQEMYPTGRPDAPDILAVWARGPGPSSVGSPSLGTFAVKGAPPRSGEHDCEGWLATGEGLPVGSETLMPDDFEAVISDWI